MVLVLVVEEELLVERNASRWQIARCSVDAVLLQVAHYRNGWDWA
jgi:hypothetical protein